MNQENPNTECYLCGADDPGIIRCPGCGEEICTECSEVAPVGMHYPEDHVDDGDGR